MGIPKRKVVPIGLGEDTPDSKFGRSTDSSIKRPNGQLNGQSGKKLPGGVNSLNNTATAPSPTEFGGLLLRSRNHRILLSYLSSQPVWITTNHEISACSGICLETVRYGLRVLEAKGCIVKSRYSNCGLRIEVIKTANELGVETQHSNSTLRLGKIDRLYNKSIYLSQEEIDSLWPRTAARGFLAVHFRELIQIFEAKGYELQNIKRALNYVEFQLAQNTLIDQRGYPVKGVPGYLMKALRENGYYSRPKNYISPEEQAELDLLAEERRITAIRSEAQKLRKVNWWQDLPPDHPAKADRVIGDKESWISHQYQKYANNEG